MERDKRREEPKEVVDFAWGQFTASPHSFIEPIYDETELLRWIIRGNPNK